MLFRPENESISWCVPSSWLRRHLQNTWLGNLVGAKKIGFGKDPESASKRVNALRENRTDSFSRHSLHQPHPRRSEREREVVKHQPAEDFLQLNWAEG